jgi:hypothetical protein
MAKAPNGVRGNGGSPSAGAADTETDAVDEKRRRLLGQLGKGAYTAPVALALMTMTAYAS